MRRAWFIALLAGAGAVGTTPSLHGQRGRMPEINAANLRRHLEVIAHDSMGGRASASRGNALTAAYLADEFRRAGLEPAGEDGGFFQTLPFLRIAPDSASGLVVGGTTFAVGRDVVPLLPFPWEPGGLRPVFGGVLSDTTSYPPAAETAGHIVVFVVPPGMIPLQAQAALAIARRWSNFTQARGFAIAMLDRAPPEMVRRLMQGRTTLDTTLPAPRVPSLLVSDRAGEAMIGGPLAAARAGQVGPPVTGSVGFARRPVAHPIRNVVAVLRGADPARRGTYVAVSAHNDHVGTAAVPVDHDSLRAFLGVVRPLGADSRPRAATPAEHTRAHAVLDSLRAVRPARPDSIFNGADDDGSGTVALLEIARTLAAGRRPPRSILVVSHAAEEVGLVGSAWFTDHPTVPRDSIIGEIDVDMIGRGGAADLPDGGAGYLEVVGARRISPAFGALLEAVNRRLPRPFTLNYAFDAPGHPGQYYCRADHYSYARYGIPSVSLSTGLHRDYHQLTDEAQYQDYEKLARVATVTRNFALAVAALEERPPRIGPRQEDTDPRAPCVQ